MKNNKEHQQTFIELCSKYQPYDERYADLTVCDGVFAVPWVDVTYKIFLMLVDSSDESNIKKAYNAWRKYYYRDSRRIHILFNYIEMLFSEQITDLWQIQWDSKDRNLDTSIELTCRIFILWGVTAQKAFNHLGESYD